MKTVRGCRLYYEIVGDGPQTVLVPNGLYYRDDFGRLAQGRTLVFYDLRNRGFSDPVDNPAFRAIETFLDGTWPQEAEKVTSIDSR